VENGLPNIDYCADLFIPECRLSSVLPQNVVWLQNESPALTSELLMSCACWERLTHKRGTASIRVFLALIVPAPGTPLLTHIPGKTVMNISIHVHRDGKAISRHGAFDQNARGAPKPMPLSMLLRLLCLVG
jgi:hypothetical protein